MREITIYQALNGNVEVRLELDAVWLAPQKLGGLYGFDRPGVAKPVAGALLETDLVTGATCAKFAQGQSECRRKVAFGWFRPIVLAGAPA